MFTRTKKLVKSMDMYGKQVELRLNGKKRHKTVCGGAVTLCNGLILSCITMYYLLKFAMKTSPNIDIIITENNNMSLEADTDLLGFAINVIDIKNNLNSSGQFQGINAFISSEHSSTLIEKGIQVQAYYSSRKESTDWEENIEDIMIPLVSCSGNNDYQQKWKELFDLPPDRAHEFRCPDFEMIKKSKLFLQGDSSERNQSSLIVIVSLDEEYLNSQGDSINAKQKLDNSLFVMKILEQKPFLDVYESPVKTLSKTITQWINVMKRRSIEVEFIDEIVKTDEGMYIQHIKEDRILGINSIKEGQLVVLPDSVDVLAISTTVNKTRNIYNRTYFKISLIFAYIGGCLQLSLILGKYLTNYFNKISFYTSFVNEVFQFEDDEAALHAKTKEQGEVEGKKQQKQQNGRRQSTKQMSQQTNNQLNSLKSSTFQYGNNNNSKNEKLSESIVYGSSSIAIPVNSKKSIGCPKTPNEIQLVENSNLQNEKQQQQQQQSQNSPQNNMTTASHNHTQNLEGNFLFARMSLINNNSECDSPQINSPFPIKKKGLSKNEQLLRVFDKYFEADRKEKRLVVSATLILKEFFLGIWKMIICQNRKTKNHQQIVFNRTLKKLAFSKKKVAQRLDISYIVQKLQEIDKLKQIVLNKNQRRLFEYLPRPVLRNDIIFPDQQPTKTLNTSGSIKQNKPNKICTEWSILREDESIQQKAIKAWIAFVELSSKETLDKTDNKVIRLLDIKAKNIFQMTSQKIADTAFPRNSLIATNKAICQSSFNIHNGNNIMRNSVNSPNKQRRSMPLSAGINKKKSSSFYQLSFQKASGNRVSIDMSQDREKNTINYLDLKYRKSSMYNTSPMLGDEAISALVNQTDQSMAPLNLQSNNSMSVMNLERSQIEQNDIIPKKDINMLQTKVISQSVQQIQQQDEENYKEFGEDAKRKKRVKRGALTLEAVDLKQSSEESSLSDEEEGNEEDDDGDIYQVQTRDQDYQDIEEEDHFSGGKQQEQNKIPGIKKMFNGSSGSSTSSIPRKDSSPKKQSQHDHRVSCCASSSNRQSPNLRSNSLYLSEDEVRNTRSCSCTSSPQPPLGFSNYLKLDLNEVEEKYEASLGGGQITADQDACESSLSPNRITKSELRDNCQFLYPHGSKVIFFKEHWMQQKPQGCVSDGILNDDLKSNVSEANCFDHVIAGDSQGKRENEKQVFPRRSNTLIMNQPSMSPINGIQPKLSLRVLEQVEGSSKNKEDLKNSRYNIKQSN